MVENTDLTKDELDFLIARLSRQNDEPTLPATDSESLTQTEVQADLKTRLQRSVDDLTANNEDVPPDLLRLIERL
jgi:hypothetical protein